MLVIAPHGESPMGPRSPSIGVCRGTEIGKQEQAPDSTPATLSREESGNSSGIPLGKPAYYNLSHGIAEASHLYLVIV